MKIRRGWLAWESNRILQFPGLFAGVEPVLYVPHPECSRERLDCEGDLIDYSVMFCAPQLSAHHQPQPPRDGRDDGQTDSFRRFPTLAITLLFSGNTYLVESSWLCARIRRRGPLAGAAIVVGGWIAVMAVGRVNLQFLHLWDRVAIWTLLLLTCLHRFCGGKAEMMKMTIDGMGWGRRNPGEGTDANEICLFCGNATEIGLRWIQLHNNTLWSAIFRDSDRPDLLLSYHGERGSHSKRHNEDIQYIYHRIRNRMIILTIITVLNFLH